MTQEEIDSMVAGDEIHQKMHGLDTVIWRVIETSKGFTVVDTGDGEFKYKSFSWLYPWWVLVRKQSSIIDLI